MDGRLINVKTETAKTGKEYVTASLMDSVKGRDGTYTNRFMRLMAFGQIAEYLKTLAEGTALIVEGSLEATAYMKDDKPVPSLSMVVDHARRPAESRAPGGNTPEVVKGTISEQTEAPTTTAVRPNPFQRN